MADELEMMEQLITDFDQFKKKSKEEQVKMLKEAKAEADKAIEEKFQEAKKQHDEVMAKVDELNKDVAEKGTTLKQALDELQEFKAKKGRIGTGGIQENPESTIYLLKQAFADEFPKYEQKAKNQKANHEFTMKAVGTMTAANNLTGNVQATYYAGSPAIRGRRRLHFRDLVEIVQSATGYWKFYRQNTPVGEGSFGFQTTHGNAKAQLDYDMTEITLNVDYLAGFALIAKQMLQDLPFMQSYVSSELVEDYLRAEDNDFFGKLYSAATGPTATSGANTAEKIIDIVAAIEENDYEVNGILVSGPVWAGILKTNLGSGAGYGVPGGITITANGEVAMMGIPLIKTPASNLGNNKVLLGDFTKAKIVQAEGLSVTMSEHDDQNFRKNLVTVKCEARVNLAILRPDAFSYFGS